MKRTIIILGALAIHLQAPQVYAVPLRERCQRIVEAARATSGMLDDEHRFHRVVRLASDRKIAVEIPALAKIMHITMIW